MSKARGRDRAWRGEPAAAWTLEGRSLMAALGLDRWWATAGESGLTVRWTAEVAQAGTYQYGTDLGWTTGWQFEEGARLTVRNAQGATVREVPLAPMPLVVALDVGALTAGRYEFALSGLTAPVEPRTDAVGFRLIKAAGTTTQLDATFVVDHAGLDPATEFPVRVDGVTQVVAGLDALADRFAPALWFDAGERLQVPFLPTDAYWNHQTGADGDAPTASGARDGARRLSRWSSGSFTTGNVSGSGLLATALVDPDDPNRLALTYYAHYPTQDGPGNSRREGDWESTTVYLARASAEAPWTPAGVGFAREGGPQPAGTYQPWNAINRNGSHATVYVARGDHAPAAGVGTGVWGDGRAFIPTNDQVIVAPRLGDEAAPSWLRFPGHWGDDDQRAPRGPAFAEGGSRWLDPWGWVERHIGDFDLGDPPALDPRPLPGLAAATVTTLDRSGSMEGIQRLMAAQAAAGRYVELLPDGDAIGVVSFSDGARVDYPLTVITTEAVRDAARAAIDELLPGGATGIGLGLRAANGILPEGANARRAIVLYSDGRENFGPDALSVIDQYIPIDVQIDTVGFGADADEAKLRAIAERRGGTYSPADDDEDLLGIFERLSQQAAGGQVAFRSLGRVAPGASREYEVVVDPSSMSLSVRLRWFGHSAELRLIRPDGTAVMPGAGVSQSTGAVATTITVTDPVAGTWRAVVMGDTSVGVDRPFEIEARLESPIVAEMLPITSVGVGNEVVVRLRLHDGRAIRNAAVTATLRPVLGGVATTVTLRDDGLMGDATAADGIYTGKLIAGVAGSGAYEVQFLAEGRSNAGADFVRMPALNFEVTGEGIANLPPVLDPIAAMVIDEGTAVRVSARAVDPNPGQSLRYELIGAPAGMSIDPSTGVITYPQPDGPLSASVTVRAVDELGASASVVVPVTVRNRAPGLSFVGTAPGAVWAGAAWSALLRVSDLGGDPVRVLVKWGEAATTEEEFAVAADGTVRLSHVFGQPGPALVVISAVDADGARDSRALRVLVHAAPRGPEVSRVSAVAPARGRPTRLMVRFAGDVSEAGADAFRLQGADGRTYRARVAWSDVGGSSQAILTIQGTKKPLAAGRYTLALDGEALGLDSDWSAPVTIAGGRRPGPFRRR